MDNLHLTSLSVLTFLIIILFLSCPSSNFNSIFYQAEFFRSQKKYEQALSKYNLLIKRYPENEKIYAATLDAAQLYDTIFQNSPTALKYYKKVSRQRLDLQSARIAYERIGELYEKDNNLVMGIDAYQQRLKYFPGEPGEDQIMFKIASAYVKLKDYSQAQLELTEWLKKFPKNPLSDQVYMKLGDIYYAKHRFKEASKIYEKVIKNYPESDLRLEAYFNMAFCLEKTGEWKKALRYYKKIENHYPNKKVIQTKIKHLSDRIKKSHRG